MTTAEPPTECPQSERADRNHSWRFDGDNPYVICDFCSEIRDAISGRVIRSSHDVPAARAVAGGGLPPHGKADPLGRLLDFVLDPDAWAAHEAQQIAAEQPVVMESSFCECCGAMFDRQAGPTAARWCKSCTKSRAVAGDEPPYIAHLEPAPSAETVAAVERAVRATGLPPATKVTFDDEPDEFTRVNLRPMTPEEEAADNWPPDPVEFTPAEAALILSGSHPAASDVAGGKPITVPHEMFPFCCKQPADSEIHGGAGGEPPAETFGPEPAIVGFFPRTKYRIEEVEDGWQVWTLDSDPSFT